ncbi:CoA ester lyase [Mesorhizobium sp. M0778]|uniref:HpcH/HpaI aldolase/citrate lyase family protein n=1 Tax=Mesorhizobium sp. M0778 TaxID=2956999 RepID=UPI003338D2E3
MPTRRLQRSELAVPATSDNFIPKAVSSNADAIFLDLEDAVAPNLKDKAREMAIRFLNEIKWGNKQMAVRVNSLGTAWAHRDIIEVVSRCPRLDLILLPKAESAFDVQFVDQLISGLGQEHPRPRPVGIEVLVETARGLAYAEEIAASSGRLEAMIFGLGDYSIDMRTYDRAVGRPSPRYSVDGPGGNAINDQWHFALARIANACRANGLRPIDGPYADFGNSEGYFASAVRAAALGFEGKWAIHPSQIDIANEVFTPAASDVNWAKDVIAALRASNEQGSGAIAIDGVLLDMAHVKMGNTILERAKFIEDSATVGRGG